MIKKLIKIKNKQSKLKMAQMIQSKVVKRKKIKRESFKTSKIKMRKMMKNFKLWPQWDCQLALLAKNTEFHLFG